MRAALGIWLLVPVLCLGCGGNSDGNGDADGDSITNNQEGANEASPVNTDGDGHLDYLDLDSDGDGLLDSIEAGDADLSTEPFDTDEDGTPDFRDLDSDGDTISDTDELAADFSVADTDADGTPDFRDADTDGDGIGDEREAGDQSLDSLPRDTDRDGIPDFRDLDSDGDCIPDAIEAGANPSTPHHSDTDGIPDYLDADSDGDGLLDSKEDLNCDGVVDANESSSTSQDTDGDGTPDLVEDVAGSDPNDATDTIPAGDFYFVLPYEGPGDNGELDFATSVRQADIFFSIDTTGSFGEEIDAIQAALEGTIIPGIGAEIPDVAFGVGKFEDFPLDLGGSQRFGLAGDVPFALLQPITTVVADVKAGLAALEPLGAGLDVPESGIEALFQWATGFGVPEFSIDPFAPPGIGGVGFRTNSLPIIVHVTDAISHAAADYPFAAHTYGETTTALNQLGIRVISVNSLENDGDLSFDPYDQLVGLAIDTSATIPPDGSGNCPTDVAGADRTAIDIDPGAGTTLGCPLVFDVLPDGSGLGGTIVDAIVQLATLGTLDISTDTVGQLVGLKGETLPLGTTTADFITAVTPVGPAPTGATIDGLVFRNVTPGNKVLFDVDAFNDFVPSTDESQLFAIDIDVLGDAVTKLDVRRVFVIVPPVGPTVD